MTLQGIINDLGISEIQIKYYQSASLLPKRIKNIKKHDFDDDDISRLKDITVLRKMGLEIETLQDFYDGKITLESLVEKSRTAQQEHAHIGAEQLCDLIIAEGYAWNRDKLWDASIKATDCFPLESMYESGMVSYTSFLKSIFNHVFKFSDNNVGITKKQTILFILAVCLGCALIHHFVFDRSFVYSFFYPFIIAAAIAVILTPIYLINKYSARTATKIVTVMIYVSASIFALLIIAVILLILNSFLHFWY